MSEPKDGRRHVLVCEDSRTYAEGLRRALEQGGDIEVVGVFERAEDAIAAIPQLHPDLVTMDIELPGISGLQAVEQIMGSHPVPILVLSAHVGSRSENAAAALAAGALDAVHKQALDLTEPEGSSGAALRHRVKILSRVRVIRHPRARSDPSPHRPSADVLLRSLAHSAGRHSVAVVLTGMGRDGGEGIEAVRAAGGLTIAQDEQTSTVFGMPRVAVEKGAELVLPLDRIADELARLRAHSLP